MKAKRTPSRDTTLSDLQLQVMQALWARDEAAASDVQQDLATLGRELALTTVSTLLTRLAKRGLVATRRDGRQVFYRATVTERDVRRGMVSGLLGTLFAGDPKALVTHLVKESELSADDLDTLKRLLASPAKGDKR